MRPRSVPAAIPAPGVNEHPLTDDESKAIASLQRLARRWPRTLKLVSMDGALAVIRNGDPRFDFDYGDGSGAQRQQCIIADIEGIPNDGGEW